jgi:tetratricopeptide (TPR) repeat protein
MRRVAAFTVLFLFSATVAAQPPGEEVKARVRKATAEYNLGQYLEAAKDYEAAYLQTLDINLLFNVAQAYRLAGETEKAITAYRSYLRSNPPAGQRALAEAKLRELEEKRGAAASPALPAAPALAPAPAPASVAPPAPTAVAPPPAALPPTAAVVASPGPETNVLVSPPPSEPPPSGAFYTRWPFWVATGAVVAGGVVAAVLLSGRGDDLKMPSATLGTKEF